MSKGQQTRERIIQLAAPIFNKHGYEGTALSDLMEATGLEKGGLYRHFASKQELAAEAFDFAWATAVRVRADGMDGSGNAVDRLKRMIQNFVEIRTGLVPGGCPLLNTAIDADDGNAVLRERVQKALDSWLERLAAIVKQGMKRGEIQKNVDASEIAALIVSNLEGALMVSRVSRNRQAMEWAKLHLYGYLEQSVRAR